ncbi:methyltransferase family protein [Pseudactinotalea sp.]|uniref:methyltransferase family protein n=1 Tax=Pseudactinotalea sp. TaxID=1926260 RepID=UPI003B3B3B93
MRPYPPLIYSGGLLLALVGHLLHPLALPSAVWVRLLAVVPFAVAVVLVVAAEREFARAATPMLPFRDASALITSGPFRFSRNPIYVAFTLIVLGVALATASWWPVLSLLPALLVITSVIRGEEERLRRIFGDEYLEYCRRVRRWI